MALLNSVKLQDKLIVINDNPTQHRFLNAIFEVKDNEIVLTSTPTEEFSYFGGFRCIDGETKIYDPVLCKYRKVKNIKGRHNVLSHKDGKIIIAKADPPYIKGKKQAYEVKTKHSKIIVSEGHRFLSDNGWVELKDLFCKQKNLPKLYVVCGCHPLTTLQKEQVISIKPKGKRVIYDFGVPVLENYIAGGFVNHNCGKSYACQLAAYMLAVFYPGCRGVYIRDTYDELKDSVIKQFNDDFEGLAAYQYKKSERKAKFLNGSEIVFRAFNYDTNILSAEYDFICMCQAEDIPEELFLQSLGRMSGKRLPKQLLMVEGNPSNTWVKKRYHESSYDDRITNKIFYICGKTEDNPSITPEYIDRLKRNYPKWWLDRYLYGLWDNTDEMVFSEYSDNILIEPIDPAQIPNSYKRRNGLDWGWVNPSAILYAYIDYDGILTIYDEFEQNKVLPVDLAKQANRYGKISTVADYSIKGIKMPTENDPDKSIWSEMTNSGAQLIPCDKHKISNIVLVNQLIKQGKLKIGKNCVNLIREIKGYKWKKAKLGAEKNLPEEALEKDNHLTDAMLYLCADIKDLTSVNPEILKGKESILAQTMRLPTRKWEELG